eukprot:2496525-Amphidinium_carterae.1
MMCHVPLHLQDYPQPQNQEVQRLEGLARDASCESTVCEGGFLVVGKGQGGGRSVRSGGDDDDGDDDDDRGSRRNLEDSWFNVRISDDQGVSPRIASGSLDGDVP